MFLVGIKLSYPGFLDQSSVLSVLMLISTDVPTAPGRSHLLM